MHDEGDRLPSGAIEVEIHVTAEDIADGDRDNQKFSPIAKAAGRMEGVEYAEIGPGIGPGLAYAMETGLAIWYCGTEKRGLWEGNLPPAAHRFQMEFNMGLDVEPFGFNVVLAPRPAKPCPSTS